MRAGRFQAMLAACVLTSGCAGPVSARVWEVGPTRDIKTPSQVRLADGDTLRIDPGEYFDCMIVRASGVTIEGTGAGATLTDKTCAGKGLLVADGRDLTVRNLTLSRARVPDQNGAGIRGEGGNLTVENVRFINNENGILANGNASTVIRIIGSTFERNGKCADYCAHAIYIGDIGLLHVERSTFRNTREGHHVKSRALRTEVVGNTIEDGPDGTASYLIDVSNGGDVLIDGNTLEKGPHTSNWGTAITIGAEGVTHPTHQIVVRGNRFTNDTSQETVFVRNLTATDAQLSGNTLKGRVVPLVGDGTVR